MFCVQDSFENEIYVMWAIRQCCMTHTVFFFFFIANDVTVTCVSGHCLLRQPAMVTWGSLRPFPSYYITRTRNLVLCVLGRQISLNDVGGLNHVQSAHEPAVCHSSPDWSHLHSGSPCLSLACLSQHSAV